jgi:hypothetical protein
MIGYWLEENSNTKIPIKMFYANIKTIQKVENVFSKKVQNYFK